MFLGAARNAVFPFRVFSGRKECPLINNMVICESCTECPAVLSVSTHSESCRYLLHEVYAVLGRITVVDQFHLYGRRQSEIPEYCHIAGDSVQIVIPKVSPSSLLQAGRN